MRNKFRNTTEKVLQLYINNFMNCNILKSQRKKAMKNVDYD